MLYIKKTCKNSHFLKKAEAFRPIIQRKNKMFQQN